MQIEQITPKQPSMRFSKESLNLDPARETERITLFIQKTVRQNMRRGAVVGISGGIDSAVVLALAVKAFGPERVVAVMMPDKDSDHISEVYARELAAKYGVEPLLEDITAALQGFDCYHRRDDAIRRVFPEFDAAKGYKAKIVLPQDLLESNTLNVFSVTIIRPDGKPHDWSLHYQPKADGSGTITVTLDDHKQTMNVPANQRKASATLTNFGLFSHSPSDGNHVMFFIDDLNYSAAK